MQIISICQSLVLTKVMVLMQFATHAIAQKVFMYLGVVDLIGATVFHVQLDFTAPEGCIARSHVHKATTVLVKLLRK